MLDSVDLASCNFSCRRSRIFNRTGKLGATLTRDLAHVQHSSADLSVVHLQCGPAANIDIITFAALDRASAHHSRSVIHPYTKPTVVFDGAAAHAEFRRTTAYCSDRDAIPTAAFDGAAAHAEAGFSAGDKHFNACALMCCAIFNRAAGHFKRSAGHIYAAARVGRLAIGNCSVGHLKGAAIHIYATAVGCTAALDRATGHLECAVAHIHTRAVACVKAADRAAGQRQCIVAVAAAHPDGTAVAVYGPAALNSARAAAVLDRQRAVPDPERFAVFRCRKRMAVQINGQTVSIVNCNCPGHHNVSRQPDPALFVCIGQLIQRRDLRIVLTAVLPVDLLPDHSFRLLPPGCKSRGRHDADCHTDRQNHADQTFSHLQSPP